jgi:hypothetical protein
VDLRHGSGSAVLKALRLRDCSDDPVSMMGAGRLGIFAAEIFSSGCGCGNEEFSAAAAAAAAGRGNVRFPFLGRTVIPNS